MISSLRCTYMALCSQSCFADLEWSLVTYHMPYSTWDSSFQNCIHACDCNMQLGLEIPTWLQRMNGGSLTSRPTKSVHIRIIVAPLYKATRDRKHTARVSPVFTTLYADVLVSQVLPHYNSSQWLHKTTMLSTCVCSIVVMVVPAAWGWQAGLGSCTTHTKAVCCMCTQWCAVWSLSTNLISWHTYCMYVL